MMVNDFCYRQMSCEQGDNVYGTNINIHTFSH